MKPAILCLAVVTSPLCAHPLQKAAAPVATALRARLLTQAARPFSAQPKKSHVVEELTDQKQSFQRHESPFDEELNERLTRLARAVTLMEEKMQDIKTGMNVTSACLFFLIAASMVIR